MSNADKLEAMADGCEIQKDVSVADRKIDGMVSAHDGDITDLQAAKLIIDRQAEQLKDKDEEIERLTAITGLCCNNQLATKKRKQALKG